MTIPEKTNKQKSTNLKMKEPNLAWNIFYHPVMGSMPLPSSLFSVSVFVLDAGGVCARSDEFLDADCT